MAEGKYGRLFTEADVLAIVDEAIMAVVDSFDAESMEDVLRVLIERAEADKAPMTFPPDEPLFLLRAQDKAAPVAIATYWEVCMGYGDPILEEECSEAHCDAVKAAGEAMEAWQAAHPERVKVPD